MKDSLLNENLKEKIINELTFQATRSSGKGGQNVNKVSSKIILSFNIVESTALNNEMKNTLTQFLGNKVSNNGSIKITSSKERSQYMNKKNAIDKFIILLEKAFTPIEKRVATKPTRLSKEKRLQDKSHSSVIKRNRKLKPDIEE